MRTVLVGAGSTGKTTICSIYAEEYGVPLIKEYIREAVVDSRINKKLSEMNTTEYRIVNEMVRSYKDKMEKENSSFIADRCLIDNFIYGSIRHIYGPAEYTSYYNYIVSQAKSFYDKIVYLPYDINRHEDDGFRMDSVTEHTYDIMLLGILHKENIKYITFNSKSYYSPKEAVYALKVLAV